jgi:hypothetical protein
VVWRTQDTPENNEAFGKGVKSARRKRVSAGENGVPDGAEQSPDTGQ